MDFVQISIGEKQKEMLQCGFPLVKSKATDYRRYSVTKWLQGLFDFVPDGALFGRRVREISQGGNKNLLNFYTKICKNFAKITR